MRRTLAIASDFLGAAAGRPRAHRDLTIREACGSIDRMSTVDDPSEHLEFLQGTLEVLILRSLQAGSNHAYGISQFLERQSGNEFLVDNGSLYPALQRLLQRAWITGQWKTSPAGRRARYYRLSASGRRQLELEVAQFERVMRAITRVIQTA